MEGVKELCKEYARRRKTLRKVEADFKQTDLNTSFEFFDEAAFAELMREVSEQFDHLSPKVQKVIQLYYGEGKTYSNIAKDLNSSPDAIRKQNSRALEIIRRKLLLFLSFF
jgi:RNA polymerase sigma factor (sigma-70 family)